MIDDVLLPFPLPSYSPTFPTALLAIRRTRTLMGLSLLFDSALAKAPGQLPPSINAASARLTLCTHAKVAFSDLNSLQGMGANSLQGMGAISYDQLVNAAGTARVLNLLKGHIVSGVSHMSWAVPAGSSRVATTGTHFMVKRFMVTDKVPLQMNINSIHNVGIRIAAHSRTNIECFSPCP